ncbi:MAG: hypothetical protein ACFCVD_20285 [Nodosilinea sp.]
MASKTSPKTAGPPPGQRRLRGQKLTMLGLSGPLMVMAYITYGGFLHSLNTIPLHWALNVSFALALAGVITIFWVPCRDLFLIGFQSDLGYFIMALVLASLAVAAVSRFHLFAYLSMLVAAALLVRVDMLILGFKNGWAFLTLSLLAILGLAISWLPLLLLAP